MRPVTIRHVADAAGVSPATVSRVLAGSPGVNAEMRERTLAAAKRLGYRANKVAQALRTRSTGTVGMVVPNISNPFFPVVIQAVERELRRRNVKLLLCDSGDDVVQEAELMASLLDHLIDGILISPCDRIASRSAVRMAAGRVPLVQVDRLAAEDLPYVGVDQQAAMTDLVDHLVSQGCARFAYVGPSMRISTAAERRRAYAGAVRRLDSGSSDRVYTGDFSLEWGREAAARILADGGGLPDAIVCANDLVAVGVMQVLQEGGVRVPADVAVSGFDDTILSTAAHPQLTTVRQPSEQLAWQAVEAVLNPGPKTTRPQLLPAGVVVRQSTMRAGSRRPARRRGGRTGQPGRVGADRAG